MCQLTLAIRCGLRGRYLIERKCSLDYRFTIVFSFHFLAADTLDGMIQILSSDPSQEQSMATIVAQCQIASGKLECFHSEDYANP